MPGALSGLLVVSIEQAVAAPYCSSRLADAGAEVIKIERPEGDFARNYDHVVHGESAYFVWLNRGKKSVVLDFKNETDKSLLNNMIAGADVFIQNLTPGAAERAGLDAATLRASNSGLIVCEISGYGADGPYATRKAYDLLVQCETGLASITGSPEGPGRVGVSVSDIACGMYAHAAILQALIARGQSGEGATIEVSLFSAIADWMNVPLLHFDYGGRAPRRVGLNHPSIAPYGAYADKHGKLIVFGIQNEREWRRLCAGILGDESLAGDRRFDSVSKRVENRAALDEIIKKVFSRQTRKTIAEKLDDAGIAYGRVNEIGDLSAHPQLRRTEIGTPSGPVSLIAPPVRFDGADPDFGGVPALGEHNDEIRRRFATGAKGRRQ